MLLPKLKRLIQKLARSVGYDICRFDASLHPQLRWQRLLKHYAIDTVLDVGANAGQFGEHLRWIGYQGRIISFEPGAVAFTHLTETAANDPGWEILNFGLGAAPGRAPFHISENTQSSSLLEMLPKHVESAPDSKYVGQEEIEIRTLDSIFDEICKPGENVYLKIDTQGFEAEVLKGAESSLPRINTLELELSLVPLYEGAPTSEDLHTFLFQKGYRLVSVEPVMADPESGELLQIDGVYHRHR